MNSAQRPRGEDMRGNPPRDRPPKRYAVTRPSLLAAAAAACTACLLYGLLCLRLWLFLAPCPSPLEGVSFSRLVQDRQGVMLRLSLAEDQKYRLRLRLDDIPPDAVATVLRYEDRYFYSHPGVNPAALCRAALTMLLGGRRMGGSTITMQTARLIWRLETGSPGDKIRQMLLALLLEQRWSKDEILETYFNLAPYGGNVEGLEAAARVYFHKTASRLTPEEVLALTPVPQHPARRRPAADNPDFTAAMRRLRRLWFHDGELAPLRVYGPADLPFEAPHVCAELLSRPGPAVLTATLDAATQRRVERALRRFAEQNAPYGLNNAAALLLHWPSMEIRALAGSADFADATIDGQVDGTRARRSPGSTLKPFIYALALDQGLIHPRTLLLDTPRSFSGYDPENFDGGFRGPIAAADALRASRNVPALTLAARLAPPGLYGFLRSAGVRFAESEEHYGLSLVLGGAETTMRELARLYAMLANRGVLRPLRLVRGAPAGQDARPLLSPEAALVTLSMLENPAVHVRSRQGRRLPLRLKTGTSNGFRDAWSVGVFGPYVLAVWVGNFNNDANPLLVGGRVAAPLLQRIAADIAASENLDDPLQLPLPGLNVARLPVCADTGDIDTSLCRDTTETWFIPGVSPIRPTGIRRLILVDTRTGLRACSPDAPHVEKRVQEFWPSELAAMFAAAGMARPTPPPLDPRCRPEGALPGAAPVILQPKAGLVHHLRPQAPRRTLILLAHADAGVRTLHWFADGRLIGTSAPGEPLAWETGPGARLLRVVDDAGRAATRRVVIRMLPQDR